MGGPSIEDYRELSQGYTAAQAVQRRLHTIARSVHVHFEVTMKSLNVLSPLHVILVTDTRQRCPGSICSIFVNVRKVDKMYRIAPPYDIFYSADQMKDLLDKVEQIIRVYAKNMP